MRKIISLSLASTAVAAVLACSAPAFAGSIEVSGYGGFQTAPHSKVQLSDQPNFTAGWEGNSFKAPQYWGVRGTYWFDGGALSSWGISLDYTHDKVYANASTLAKNGFSHFEFTDGLNLLTVNALYKFNIPDSKFVPYVGAGVGINVPHVELTRATGRTFDYQLGGATVQAQVGVRYEFTENWSAFAEYKGNYSWIDVDVDSGATIKTKILTNAVNLGVSYKF